MCQTDNTFFGLQFHIVLKVFQLFMALRLGIYKDYVYVKIVFVYKRTNTKGLIQEEKLGLFLLLEISKHQDITITQILKNVKIKAVEKVSLLSVTNP